MHNACLSSMLVTTVTTVMRDETNNENSNRHPARRERGDKRRHVEERFLLKCKGFLFDNFQQYWDASPLKYAGNVRTPTLILHSDNDYRVPLEQGEQWFRALQHYGVVSEFVIFPRENHNLTRTGEPKHLVESLNWQLYWFDRFLNKNAGAKAPDVLYVPGIWRVIMGVIQLIPEFVFKKMNL